MQQMQQPFSGNTPYSQLPDNAKRAIDQIYQMMMQHRRTLASVKTMAPSLLNTEDNGATTAVRGERLSPADAAAGSPRRPASNTASLNPSSEPLPRQMVALETQIQTLMQSAETNLAEARNLKSRAGESAVQAKMHGAWPVENVAARRGVALSSFKKMVGDAASNNAPAATAPSAGGAPAAAGTGSGAPASSLNTSGMNNIDAVALQQIMDVRAAHVDRIEAMPSPYFWEVLHNFEQRAEVLRRDVETVASRLAIAEEAERVQSMGGGRAEMSLLLADGVGGAEALALYEGGIGAGGLPTSSSATLSQKLATLARSQNDLFLRISAQAARSHEALEDLKLRYQRFCRAYTKGGYYDDPFLRADVEEVGREREMQRRIMEEQIAMAPPAPVPPAAPGAPAAPAPAGGLFGTPAPAPAGGLFGTPAPAPSTGLFGAPAAPAPATGGLFGAPAPAPAGGGLFGAPAPAPATGGLFGAPAPAPAGGGLFGSTTPAPAPAGGGLFGSTPAPAPAGGGLFGSTSVPTFGAAPTTPASTLAPRKKSGSRSGGRRR